MRWVHVSDLVRRVAVSWNRCLAGLDPAIPVSKLEFVILDGSLRGRLDMNSFDTLEREV